MRGPSKGILARASLHTSTPRKAWLESAFITLLLPAAGWAWNAQDPFFLQASVPWVVLAPLLVGLHHGFACAFASALCVLGGAVLSWRMGLAQIAAFPVGYAAVVGLLGPLAGEYRDTWQRALAKLRHEDEERCARLKRLTRAYHLLKRSHDLLEQRMASGGPSLQAVLERAQDHLRGCGEYDLAGAAGAILRLFGDYGQVQVASLHMVRGGRMTDAPAAELGKAPPVTSEHPMVLDAIITGTLTSVREERLAAGEHGPLACVPLVDVDGRVWGAVVIHEMPFISLHEEHLALLAVLGGRVGDWLAERADIRRLPVPASAPRHIPEQSLARSVGG